MEAAHEVIAPSEFAPAHGMEAAQNPVAEHAEEGAELSDPCAEAANQDSVLLTA